MPASKSKSGLVAKYGEKLKQAVKKHAADPVDYGNMRLPPGITNGVAKLVGAKFDVYQNGDNQGEYYFRATGVVVSPKEVALNGSAIPVAGLQTSIIMPCCQTKQRDGKAVPLEENVGKILNEMRKMGLEIGEDASAEELEEYAEALKEAGPYFHFATSQSAPTVQYPDPRTWENWYGSKGLEDYVPDEGEAVEDETGEKSEESEETETGADGGESEDPPTDDGEVEGGEAPGDHELDELVAAAKKKDTDAQEKLSEIAGQVGLEDKEIEDAPNWSVLADLIREKRDADTAQEDEPAEEGEAFLPEKGQIFSYKPLDPKTKKPFVDPKTKKARKSVECEVMAVDKKSETITLKNLDDGKSLYKSVKWDQLEWTE